MVLLNGCRAVSEIACRDDIPRYIYYMLVVGRGYKEQIWVLERLQKTQMGTLVPLTFDAVDCRYTLCVLGFSILVKGFLAIAEQSTFCLSVLLRPLRISHFAPEAGLRRHLGVSRPAAARLSL
jgi:hypothetical protein